jgi:hypothetical protein
MTDFGTRTGQGDMLKADYDADQNGVVDSVPGHHASHESGGSDEIDISGLTGTTPTALLADTTPGRVLREMLFAIDNGTNPNTLYCFSNARWNHTPIAVVDNIAKGATTGGFTLSADGTVLTITTDLLEGNVIMAIASIYRNVCNTIVTAVLNHSSNTILIRLSNAASGAILDLTALVDTGPTYLTVLYITDA